MKFKQPIKRLGALAAAGAVGMAGVLAFSAPAQAEDVTGPGQFKETHKNHTADSGDWGKHLCGSKFQVPDDKPADQDGWVFILPGGTAEFVSLTATFKDGDGETEEIAGTPVPTGGDNNTKYKHAYVEAPAGWTLLDAVAELTGTNGDPVGFHVTHTCSGTPDDESTPPGDEGSSTPPGDETTPPGEDESTTPGEESTSPAGDEQLPTTGAPLTIALVSAGALAATGSALFVMMRRRRAAENW